VQQFQDDHRGHTIFLHASGPTGGPWVAAFSAWKIEPNNSYRAVVQGALPGVYPSVERAHAAATSEAKSQLDALLNAK
jgi:hypothetical protein